MKIAVFTDTYYPKVDGIVTSIMNSTKGLAMKGGQIIIFAPKYKQRGSIKLHPNIKVYRSYSLSLFSYKEVKVPLPNIRKVIKTIKEFSPDVIHLHTPGTLGLLGLICSKLYDIPSIGTYHTILSEQITYISLKRLTKLDKMIEKIKIERLKTKPNKSKYFSSKFSIFLKKRAIRRVINAISFKSKRNEKLGKKIIWKLTCKFYNACDLITVPSKSIVKELRKYSVTKPIKVLSNGIDLNSFLPKKSYNRGKVFAIVHVGRISFEKNIDVILRAYSILLKQRKNVFLKIVGDGPALRSLKNLAKSLEVSKKINFTGYRYGKELIKEYQSSDLFVTASTMETQGLTVLEAMSCGLPVIGVRKYAIPDLVKHGVNGYIAKPFNKKEIKDYIIKFIDNPDLLTKFGKKSVEIAREHDLKNVIEKLERLNEEASKITK